MTLNTKLAFEIWAGIVVLIIVIGGMAGATLMFGGDAASLLTRTQVNSPTSTPNPTPFLSDSAIQDVSLGISQTLLGGTNP